MKAFVLLPALLLLAVFSLPFVSANYNFSQPNNWIVRVGGSFGENVENVTPGAPYMAMKYYPADVEIFEGDSITFVFNSQEVHTVSFVPFTSPINISDPLLESLQQATGGDYYDNQTSTVVSSGLRPWHTPNYTLTFNATGDFPYVCVIHPPMVGIVRVRDTSVTLVSSPDEVFQLGNDQLDRDLNYSLSAFVTDAQLLEPVPYTLDSDGYRTWTVRAGVYAQPANNTAGIGPISAYGFYPGNGAFNITEGDRITFVNADDVAHTLALQDDDIFVPLTNKTNPTYIVEFIPNAQLNLTYRGGFYDYGLLVPLDPDRDNKTITFEKEGTFYVFCTLHSDLGMHAEIRVAAEEEEEPGSSGTSEGSSGTSEGGGTTESSTGDDD